MGDFTAALATALALIVRLDRDLVAIVSLSLLVWRRCVVYRWERRWRSADFLDETRWEPCSML